MGLTSAMYTGLTGMSANQTRIDAIGHNVANVNTTAYKGTRTLFQTQFAQTVSMGTPPSDRSGGVNPIQLGRGVGVGAIQRNFTPGSIEGTGIPSDLALEGNGFFVLRRGDGTQAYTRDGAFRVNTANQLVSLDGNYVRGYGVDAQFNVVPGVLTDLSVPLGTLSLARPTENVIMDGDLSAASAIATQGSTTMTQALVSGAGAPADGTTQLTDLRSADNAAVALFEPGASITIRGATKGDRAVPDATFVVGTDGNTLQDFADWLERTLAIQENVGAGTPGVTIENGALVIRSNAGAQNAIGITGNDLVGTTAAAPLPFTFTQTGDAAGDGIFTSFTVYDSLGNASQVNVSFALDSTPDTGPVWRYYVESPDSQSNTRVLGTGTVTFDTQGNFVSATGNPFTLDRTGTGAASPLTFNVDFSQVHGLSTQTSAVIMAEQDGFPPGTLNDFGIGPDGVVTGTFSNGLTRTLGQVAVATFANPEGLVAEADNLYVQGPNSGEPLVTEAGQFGAGLIQSGALELSNVDLSNEFIGLITSSTGFQAASRVISVSNELLDQLLLIVR